MAERSTTTALATRQRSTDRRLGTLTDQLDLQTIGQVLVKSGYFAGNEVREVAQALVKILAGRELGFGPIASMQGVYVVKGRVTLSANLVGAAIQRSGRYRYQVEELSNEVARIAFFDGERRLGESSFSVEDARLAGLANGDNWRKYTRNMLYARALTNGARWYTPEVFNGPIYTPEELGAVVDGESGDVIEPAWPRSDGVPRDVVEHGGRLVDGGTGEVIADQAPPPSPSCEECGLELKETRFKDGTTWGPEQLAGYGRRKHGRVLCMDHYRAANEERKAQLDSGAAEESEALLARWRDATARAAHLAVEHKTLAANAPMSRVRQWVEALEAKVAEAEKQQVLDKHPVLLLHRQVVQEAVQAGVEVQSVSVPCPGKIVGDAIARMRAGIERKREVGTAAAPSKPGPARPPREYEAVFGQEEF